ncbi:splicing factor, proline- and glutamine-rich-like [Ipomoea triloba]|uniref:splicing factor, proline- and glutamine-rich-like n=1 Tax=Ipomoea triloba TaxID=35885 RepID=UPI00125D9E78|nr:splicing factor, proline- and glutamine-rich-like [Ipomoea triloba]
MDVHMERPRRSVPQFGGWDQKGGGGGSGGGEEGTNYTVVFTQARADRKQHKTELPTAPPLHNTTNSAFAIPPPHQSAFAIPPPHQSAFAIPPPHQSAFSNPPPHHKQQLHLHHHHHQNTTVTINDASVKRKKGVLSCFSCFSG